MPNWCDNSLTVSHEDPAMMKKFSDGVNDGNLFATLIPTKYESAETPEEGLGWYAAHVDEWGTKWDVADGQFELEADGLSGHGWFMTAWSPPTAAFEKLKALGFSIDALYNECGMGFAGTWVDGEENYVDDYYELFQDENWRDQVEGEDLINLLEAEYESWFDNQEEKE
jgi:hypothetical protein